MCHRKQNCQTSIVDRIFPESQIIRVRQTASTNSCLQHLSEQKKLPEGAIVVTDNQTCGRGTGCNSWESETSANVCMSIILYPTSTPASEQFILSKVISLAVYDFLSEHLHKGVSVKWPNDIYVDDKKISGILIENYICGDYITKTIAGIGININQEHFLSDAPNPVSLRQITGKTYSIENCLQTIRYNIAKRYSMAKETPVKIHSEYLQHLYRFGKLCQYSANGVIFSAIITGVNMYGMLEMKTSNGVRKTFGFKELKIEN